MLRASSQSQLAKSSSDGQQQHTRYQRQMDTMGSGCSTPTTHSNTPCSGSQTPLAMLLSFGSGNFGSTRQAPGSLLLLRKMTLAVLATILVWFAALCLLQTTVIPQVHHTQQAEECPTQPPWFADAQQELQLLESDIQHLQAQIDHLEGLLDGGSGSNSNRIMDGTTLARLGMVPGNTETKPAPFLFIGVLSVAHTRERREAARATWMAAAPSEVMVRFVLYEEERSASTEEEAAERGDIIYVRSGGDIDYRSIHRKVLAMVVWVAENINPNFVLKTDDDAYVDCGRLVEELRSRCAHPDCRNERLYMGEEKRNGVVITDASNKWSNLEYWQHTGLREYMPYMYGGGYIFSGDIARALHLTNKITPLKNMPNEDATFGFWVSGMNLVRVAHPKIRTAAGQCCLYTLPEHDSLGRWQQHRLRVWEDMCAGWLVLHKVDSTGMMRYLHERITSSCPEEVMLLEKATELAAAIGEAPSTMPPLQMFMLSDSDTGYHFSGIVGGSPWSADGRYVLGMRTMQLPHDVAPDEELQIGVVDMSSGKPLTLARTGWAWRQLDTSRAWNYHAGAHAQWLGQTSDLLLFNDRSCQVAAGPDSNGGEGRGHDQLCAVVYSISEQRRVQVLPRPVYSTSHDGSKGLSVDLIRIEAATPGWGYATTNSSSILAAASKQSGGASLAARLFADPAKRCPADDGLWLMDLQSGNSQLLVSYHELLESVLPGGRFGRHMDEETDLPYAGTPPDLPKDALWNSSCLHSIDQPLFAADDSAIAFRYRISNCTGEQIPSWAGPDAGTHVYLFTINTDGTGLWRVPGVAPGVDSHLDYGVGGKLLVCQAEAAYLVQHKESVTTLAKPKPLVHEALGSCRFAPGSTRHVLGETRGNGHTPHKLYIWDLQQKDAFIVGLYFDADWHGPSYTMGTLQPKWSRDGRYIVYDSSVVWSIGMQMYATAVHTLQVPVPATLPKQGAVSHAEAQPVQQSQQQGSSSSGSNSLLQSSAAGSSLASSSGTGRHLQRAPWKQRQQQQQRLKSKQQRQLFVDLTAGVMSGLRHLHHQGVDLSLTEVHVFGVSEKSDEVQHLKQQEQLAVAQLLLHAEQPAAEDSNGWAGDNSTYGDGSYGVLGSDGKLEPELVDYTSVGDILPLLFGSGRGGGYGSPQRPRLQRIACWLTLHWLHFCGSSHTSRAGEASAAAALLQQRQDNGRVEEEAGAAELVDFSKWLLREAKQDDTVVLALDLPAEQQFDILRSLLLEEALLLVDHVLVRWHVTAARWHMMHLWERVLADLGISWEYIV